MTTILGRSIWLVCALALSACGTRTSIDSTPYRTLQIGESYRVTSGLTGLPASFNYLRPSERRYRVTVPAIFRAHEAALPQSAVDQMAAKTAVCLAGIQPGLVGPNGEELEIQLVHFGISGMRPLEVEVTGRRVRGHARLWQANWSCPEITHEVFHFLGLVDKYPEPPTSGRYDCRHKGPHSSVMYDPWDAYVNASPILESHVCSCKGLAGDALDACTEAIGTIDRESTSCPAGTLAQFKGKIVEYAYPALATQLILSAGRPLDDDPTSTRIVMRTPPKRPNLLTAAEFRVIAHPNWLQGNSRYYACATDAYRTSKALGGDGCFDADVCAGEDWSVQ